MPSQTDFFNNSDGLDRLVLRPLSHISLNWELTWDRNNQQYLEEENSFAKSLNKLIEELRVITPPLSYYNNEDILANYVVANLKWPIQKIGGRWIGADYQSILEQGGHHDLDENNLILAASGRIKAAIKFGQKHFDDMEPSHKEMLAAVMAIIIYHRGELND